MKRLSDALIGEVMLRLLETICAICVYIMEKCCDPNKPSFQLVALPKFNSA